MDASKKAENSSATIDFIIGKFSHPQELTNQDYSELFEYINNLLYPVLSSMGMSRLNDVGGKLKHHLNEYFFEGTRLTLVHSTVRKGAREVPGDWEVYLTDKGHWIIITTWGKNKVTILREGGDFRNYLKTEDPSEAFVHPSHWLLDAPRFVVERTLTRLMAREQVLKQVRRVLRGIDQRFIAVDFALNEKS